MANHAFFPFLHSLEAKACKLFARLVFSGGSSAPTLQIQDTVNGGWTNSTNGAARGLASVARNGAGDFTITLDDRYLRLLAASASYNNPVAVGLPKAPVVNVKADTTVPGASGGGTVGLQTIQPQVGSSSAQGAALQYAAADPAANEVLMLELTLGDSSA